MKIVLLDAATVTNGDIDLSVFLKLGNLTIYDITAPDKVAERKEEAEAVICNKALITRDAIYSAKHLRYVGLFATGYNNIDICAARELGITVCNAGSYSTNSVAQHVFAFILNYASKVAEYNSFVAQGNWINSRSFSPFVYDTTELFGKTIGIFGFGSIGKAVAEIARSFGMNVIASTRTPCTDNRYSYVRFVDFQELLSSSDFLTVHCPLTDRTACLFDSKAFSAMKKGCYFINTSRGGVLDENALLDALESSHLAGAAIDVLTEEPMRRDCPLYGAPNITITPHVAWAPYETRKRLIDIVFGNLRNFISGTPTNVVS